MKKEYTTPTVDKIAFNYRDQVVAASAVVETEEQGGSEGNNGINWGDGNLSPEEWKEISNGLLGFLCNII